MIVFEGKIYPSLAESRWAKPQPNAILSMFTLTTDNTVDPKRKLWEDADVEVEKRHCRNPFPLIRPIRIIKTPTTPQAHDSPALLQSSTGKTKGKRICPPSLKTPRSKVICRSLHYPRAIRKMLVPLLARRSSYIFPPTSKAKRGYEEGPEMFTSKRLHKEEDNQALCMHLARHDHNYQPMPRIRLGSNSIARQSFSQTKYDENRSRANSLHQFSKMQAVQSDINCMDIDNNQDLWPTEQPIQAIGDSMEVEVHQDPQPVPYDTLHPIDSQGGPGEHDDLLSEIQYEGVEMNGLNNGSCQEKHSPLPPVHRRRRFAHIKGTSDRVRGDLETLTIDGDAMVGLISYPLNQSNVMGWLSRALATRMVSGRDALSYFRRLIGNFIDRPPRPCRYDPCSAWGLLSV